MRFLGFLLVLVFFMSFAQAGIISDLTGGSVGGDGIIKVQDDKVIIDNGPRIEAELYWGDKLDKVTDLFVSSVEHGKEWKFGGRSWDCIGCTKRGKYVFNSTMELRNIRGTWFYVDGLYGYRLDDSDICSSEGSFCEYDVIEDDLVLTFYSLNIIDPTFEFEMIDRELFFDNTVYIYDNRSTLDINHTAAPYDKLISYWNFDGSNDTDHIYSVGEFGFDLTATASTPTISEWGYIGRSLNVTGDNDYVYQTHAGRYDVRHGATVMGWTFYEQDGIGNNYWFNIGSRFYLRDWGDSIGCWIKPTTGWASVIDTSDRKGNWTHTACSWNGTFFNVYIDGKLIGNTTTARASSQVFDDYSVGAVVSHEFDGYIDEVMVFKGALSGDEITNIYNNQSRRYMEEGTVTLKSFNGTTNSTWIQVKEGSELPPNTTLEKRYGGWGKDYGYNTTSHSSREAFFDGATTYVGLGDDTSINFTEDMSAFVWVNTGYTGGNINGPLSKWKTSSNDRSWTMRLQSGDLRVILSDDGTFTGGHKKDFYTSGTIVTGGWMLVGFTFDGSLSELKLYIDGIDYHEDVVITTNDSITSLFGADAETQMGAEDGSAQYLRGNLDNAYLFNTSLTAGEVFDLYNRGKDGHYYHEDLVANINFDGGNYSDSAGDNEGTCNGNCHIGDMMAYFHLDDDYSDALGNYPDGVPKTATIDNATGMFNNSIYFDGESDRVNTTIYINATLPFSVSLWMTERQYKSFAYAFQWGDGGWMLDRASDKIRLITREDSGGSVVYTQISKPETFNTSTHIVGVSDGFNTYLYINGVLEDSDISDNRKREDTPRKTCFGANCDNYWASDFNGTIDEVMIWNKTLTDEDVKELYIKGRPNWQWSEYRENDYFLTNTSYTNHIAEYRLSTDGVYSPILYSEESSKVEMVESTNVSDCGGLGDADTIYYLFQDVVKSDTCFIILANNITLDGQGYTVNFSDGAVGHGVDNSAGFHNFTLLDINVKATTGWFPNSVGYYGAGDDVLINHANFSAGSSGWEGSVYLEGAERNRIYNSILKSESALASSDVQLYALTGSDNGQLINSTANASYGGYAIYLSESPGWFIDNSRVYSISYADLVFYYSDNSTVQNTVLRKTENPISAVMLWVGDYSSNVTIKNISFYNDSLHTHVDIDQLSQNTLLEDVSFQRYNWDDTSGISGLTIRNTSLGEISFTSGINGTGYWLPDALQANNFTLNNPNMSSPANITLYGLSGWVTPVILKDGVYCSDCANFSSKYGANVSFNVSGWSSYSVGNASGPPIIVITYPNGTIGGDGFQLNVTTTHDVDSWLLSIDEGDTNYTFTPGGTISLNSSGSYEIWVWGNDTLDQLGWNTSGITYVYVPVSTVDALWDESEMAIADITIVVLLFGLFNYFLVYRKNKFWGNLLFVLMGGFILILGDGNIYDGVGTVVIMGSLISLIFDATKGWHHKTQLN